LPPEEAIIVLVNSWRENELGDCLWCMIMSDH
jgi:hypothetical protein